MGRVLMIAFLLQLAGCLFLLAVAVLLLTAAVAWLLATVGAFRDVVRRQVLREAADELERRSELFRAESTGLFSAAQYLRHQINS